MGWFNVLIVAYVTGYYLSPIHIPFLLPPYPLPLSTPATQAKFIVVSGRKDGVDLVLIYRFVEKEVILHQNKVYPCNLIGMLTETSNGEHAHNAL